MAKLAGKTGIETTKISAKHFIDKLTKQKLKEEKEKNARHFREKDTTGNKILSVRMGTIFKIAKEFDSLSLKDIKELLDSEYYEIRMGAVSIMDFQARKPRVSEEHKKALYNLYIKQHSRIDNWDMVDRSAQYVVGAYLFDKPKVILAKLVKSKNVWERRTAIVSTGYFIRKGQVDDTI